LKRLLCPWVMLLAASLATAAELPRRSVHDVRVRYVTYKPDDVVVINVRRGVVTRLILEADEKITTSGTGFAAQCDKEELEWCIRADPGTNQVWVKPRERATHNNLELATSKRDYSMRFNVLPDAPTGSGIGAGAEMYRVIFQYPVARLPLPMAMAMYGSASAATSTVDDKALLASRLASRPVARNTQYSMQALGDGKAIAPSLAFDDGRFTYLRFANNREMPAPFAVGADRAEKRVNFHVEGDLMVIHHVVPQLVLRLGEAVVGIWNDAYDAGGVATPKGVAVPGVSRAVK
jgi:type IV secretion system protein VirB9